LRRTGIPLSQPNSESAQDVSILELELAVSGGVWYQRIPCDFAWIRTVSGRFRYARHANGTGRVRADIRGSPHLGRSRVHYLQDVGPTGGIRPWAIAARWTTRRCGRRTPIWLLPFEAEVSTRTGQPHYLAPACLSNSVTALSLVTTLARLKGVLPKRSFTLRFAPLSISSPTISAFFFATA